MDKAIEDLLYLLDFLDAKKDLWFVHIRYFKSYPHLICLHESIQSSQLAMSSLPNSVAAHATATSAPGHTACFHQEIERLRMELQRTSIKQQESFPELTPVEFVQEERVAQWMRLCVGALKEFLGHAGSPLQRPLNHEGANEQGAAPPCPVIMSWRTAFGKCCASGTHRT